MPLVFEEPSWKVYILHTRLVRRTLESRGKSLTPESRISMDESRSCNEDWREVTEEDREAAILR